MRQKVFSSFWECFVPKLTLICVKSKFVDMARDWLSQKWKKGALKCHYRDSHENSVTIDDDLIALRIVPVVIKSPLVAFFLSTSFIALGQVITLQFNWIACVKYSYDMTVACLSFSFYNLRQHSSSSNWQILLSEIEYSNLT